jgi:hypothetical protein
LIILGLNQSDFVRFFERITCLYSQAIFCRTYFVLAPKLLFRKKYLLFTLVSLSFVMFSVCFGQYIQHAQIWGMRPPPPPRGDRKAHLPILINLLLYVSMFGDFLETFFHLQKK